MNATSSRRAIQQRIGTWLATGLCAVLMAACSVLPELPLPGRSSQPAPQPSRPAAQAPARPAPSISDFSGSCQQTEDDGFSENARLSIVKGQVQALDWQIRVGRRGQCTFKLKDFRQTRQSPHIELKARAGGRRSSCKLLVYSETRRVTLAHSGCDAFCSKPGLSEEAWPVMFNPESGRCASLDR